MAKKLEVKDLLDAIYYVTKNTSSNDCLKYFNSSPVHILVYNEIKRFSKEELEGCNDLFQRMSLFDLAIKNPLLLSAFIEKGAFIDKLTTESQWIINSCISFDDFAKESLFFIEEDLRRKNRGNMGESIVDRNNRNKLFYFLIDYPNQNDVNLLLIDKFYNDFGKKEEKRLLRFIINYINEQPRICEYLLVRMLKDNVDLNNQFYLNRFLPKDEKNGGSFFISSNDTPKIKKLLDIGFRFDESYSYSGDNLFISVIKSERKDIFEILPYLKNVKPIDGKTIEEQNEFIQSLEKTHPNTYKEIQILYYKNLLELELKENNSKQNNKLKI